MQEIKQTTQTINNLSTGDYTVTITDSNGCTDQATARVNPGTCLNLSVTGTSSPVICNGESNGSVSASVTGGSGNFNYTWDSIPNTTASVSNLPAGDYTITVTDNVTACSVNSTITINEPNILASGIAVTNVLCKNNSTGSLDLTVNGGTSPYSFTWNNGASTEDLANVGAGTVTLAASAGALTILAAGDITSGGTVSLTGSTGSRAPGISAQRNV